MVLKRRDFNRYALAAAALATMPLTAFAAAEARVAGMTQRQFGAAEESLPVIGLGNSAAFNASDGSVAEELIELLLQHGGGYVDLSGASRYSMGSIAAKSGAREKLFLGNYLDLDDSSHTNEFVKSLAATQGGTQLDLVQSRDIGKFRANAGFYARLKSEGLARHVGAARFGPAAMKEMEGFIKEGLVDFVQINYSMLEPAAADRFLPLAQDHGVAVMINRPFINGRYFEIVRGTPLPEWAAEFDCESWAQFSLKYIISNPAVTCVLTETSKMKHAVDNLGAGYGRLPDAKMRSKMQQFIRSLS